MVVRILENITNSKKVLQYNDIKVEAGGASVFFIENVPGGYPNVKKLFHKYETNPKINAHMIHRCIHLAISPGPEDEYDDGKIMAFIKEVVEKIGYAAQPQIVYKHNDIEREHFHFAAPKMTAEGKAIRWNFSGSNWDYYGMRKALLEIGPKYGFQVVFEKKKKCNSEFYEKTGLFDSKKSDYVFNDLKSIFFKALKYNYKSPQEFRDILFHFGVKWTDESFKKEKIAFQGYNSRDDVKTSRIYPMDISLKHKGYTRFVDRLGNNSREEREIESGEASVDTIESRKMDIAYLMAICRHFFLRSRSSEEFRKLMAEGGVGVRILRKDGRYDSDHAPGEILGPVKSLSFVVRKRFYVCSGDIAQNFLSAAEIEKAEKSGRWTGRGEQLITKRLITDSDVDAIELAIRTNMKKAGIGTKMNNISVHSMRPK